MGVREVGLGGRRSVWGGPDPGLGGVRRSVWGVRRSRFGGGSGGHFLEKCGRFGEQRFFWGFLGSGGHFFLNFRTVFYICETRDFWGHFFPNFRCIYFLGVFSWFLVGRLPYRLD